MTIFHSFVDIPTLRVLAQFTVFYRYKFLPDKFPYVFSGLSSKRENLLIKNIMLQMENCP